MGGSLSRKGTSPCWKSNLPGSSLQLFGTSHRLEVLPVSLLCVSTIPNIFNNSLMYPSIFHGKFITTLAVQVAIIINNVSRERLMLKEKVKNYEESVT